MNERKTQPILSRARTALDFYRYNALAQVRPRKIRLTPKKK
jgi:hypothetical protein